MTDERRIGDATQSDDFGEIQDLIAPRPIVGYRNSVTGEVVEPGSGRIQLVRQQGGGARHVDAPARLTPQEEELAAESIQAVFDEVNTFSPSLAQSLKNNPHLIPYMTELQLGLNYRNPQTPEPAHEMLSAILEDPVNPERMADVRDQINSDGSLGIMWNETGSMFNMAQRQALLHILSSITQDGADRVAARAIAYLDLNSNPTSEELFANIYSWTYAEQQAELGRLGAFGALDLPQETREDITNNIFRWIDSRLTSPEEAARRADMSEGERAAFLLGLAPGENLVSVPDWVPFIGGAEMSTWDLVSGSVDGWGEIAGDPLNAAAGFGLGMKALKTVSIGNRAIKAGKVAAAGRAIRAFVLPRRFSGVAAGVKGGRTARAMYAWSPKTLDTLLDGMRKSGVAADVHRLVKKGDIAQMKRNYPQFARLSDTAITAIAHAKDDEMVVEVLRHAAANNIMDDGVDAVRAADEVIDTMARQFDADDLQAGIAGLGDDLVFHGTTKRNADKVLSTGRLKNGGLTTNADVALEHARKKAGQDGVVLVWNKADLPVTAWRDQLDRTGEIATVAQGGIVEGLPRFPPVATVELARVSTLEDLLLRADNLRPDQLQDLMLKVVDAERRTNLGRRTVFTLWDVPRKIAKTKTSLPSRIPGTGRTAQAARRIAARVKGPAVEDQINVFDGNKGANQIRKLLEHYGASPEFVKTMLDEWTLLRVGQRFDWVMETMLPKLGAHIDVPVLEYDLVQYFTKKGLRRFSSGLDDAVDHWVDAAGNHRYDPVIPSQMQNTIPIPIQEIDQIVRRSKSATRAIGLRGRGFGATNARRKQLVQRFHRKLVKDGQLPEGHVLDAEWEDRLWTMAYSYINDIGDDGRGVVAGTILPKAGNVWGGISTAFTKSMLVLRPFQWMLRVAIIEEQLRAYMMNMPSFYRNPVTYMQDLKDAALLTSLQGRRARNLTYAQEVQDLLMSGVKNGEDAKAVLTDRGLWKLIADDLDPDEVPSLSRIEGMLASYLSKAVNDRTRLDKLSPVKRASLRVRRNAKKIEKGEKILDAMGRPSDWSIVDDVPEIQQRMLQTYFGRQAGASGVQPRFWGESMSEADAFEYGYAYGQKVGQMLQDDFARLAFRRVIAQMSNQPLAGNDGKALVHLPEWRIMRDMLAERFGIIDDDVALAERYLDEVLEPEIIKLMEPLTAGMDDTTTIRTLRNLEQNRRYRANLGGIDYDIDLTSGNFGKALNDFGDLVADQRVNSDVITFPRQILGNSTDMRFMASDDKRFYTRWSNHILQFAGEGVTQVLNRRPAYLRTYRRYHQHYLDIGVEPSLAVELAHNHAAEAVNYVYFNSADAPYVVQKLNGHVPFFTATYEVMNTWAFKMPEAVGGYWHFGAGEFARRMQRLMDGLVNIGLVTREKQDDGSVTHTINLSPNLEDYNSDLGGSLGALGFQAIRGLAFIPEQLLNLIMETDADGLYDDGISITVGHPLNPQDYGVLSFAQANIGLNPVPNLAVSALAATTGLAADTKRTQVAAGETLADVAARLEVEVEELARHNRGLIAENEELGYEVYEALLAGQITPDEIQLPAGASMYDPSTSMWDAIEEIFMPFGKITDVADLPINFLPGVIRWGLMGLGVAQTPTDEFWKGEFDSGMVGAFLPTVNQNQMAGQTTEAFMYLEAHDRINGKGPWQRIEEKKAELAELLESDRSPENRERINKLESLIKVMEREYLERVRNLTAGSLVTRMMLGQVLPTAPRHLRAEQNLINQYWSTRDYADKLRTNQFGIENLQVFRSEEQIMKFFEDVGTWLGDNTGDDMRAKMLNENPALMSYLTPKSFWKDGGVPPQLNTFDEWQEAVIRGDIVQAPLAVTLGRARSSHIQAEFYTTIQAEFGGDTPEETVANALNNWERYQEIVQDKNRAYDALFLEDDFMGGEYEEWLNSRSDTDFALEKYQELDNQVRDSMTTLLQMEQELDETYELSEIQNLRSSIRGALSKLSDSINEWEDLAGEDNNFFNPFEQAMNRYWKEVYEPYSEEIGALYDSIDETFDSEERSLVFERIKILRNEYAGMQYTFEGSNTPMPSPLDIQWMRKTEDEKTVFLRNRIKNPAQWLDLDAVTRILDVAPHLETFVPSSDRQMLIWQQYTLDKIRVDEAYEREQITSGERTKANAKLEENLRAQLMAEGRGDEIVWFDMYPIERLAAAGQLPGSLEYLVPEVRWYKQVLQANDVGANASKARQMLDPFYQQIKAQALQNPQLQQDLYELGSSLYDETTYDKLLPQLLFGLFDLQED